MPTSSTILRATAALIGILAIALVASTIPEVLDQSSDGFGNGGGNGGDGAAGEEMLDEPVGGSSTYGPLLFQVLAIVTAVVLIIGFVALLVDDPHRFLKGLATVTVAIGIVVAIMVAGLTVMDLDLSAEETEPEVQESGEGELEDGQESDSDGADVPGSILVVAIGLLVAAIGLAGLLWRRIRDEQIVEGEPETESASDLVGAVAGETADRIESANDETVENEVYRAWREMTSLLSVENPDSSTPREFAGAAVDAGLGREEVAELTSLFETVRYGGIDATSTDERRAVEILRRVEAAAEESTLPDDNSATAGTDPSISDRAARSGPAAHLTEDGE